MDTRTEREVETAGTDDTPVSLAVKDKGELKATAELREGFLKVGNDSDTFKY